MWLVTRRRFDFSAARQLAGRWRGDNFALWVDVLGLPFPTEYVAQSVERYPQGPLDLVLDDQAPTTINLARALWADLKPRLAELPVKLVSLELAEEAGEAAIVADSETWRVARGGFSAAHRTHAPRLSPAENLALYGKCANPAGHGHNYEVEAYFPGELFSQMTDETLGLPSALAEFDHKNLSVDIPDLARRNVVTEAIAELFARRLPEARRFRVWETPDFFAEYRVGEADYRLGRRYRFHAVYHSGPAAAGRLDALRPLISSTPALAPDAERKGVPGHLPPQAPSGRVGDDGPDGPLNGHAYQLLVTLKSPLDPRTEAAFDLGELDRIASDILRELDYTCLDREVAFFRAQPVSAERVAHYVWSKFETHLGAVLETLQVGETATSQALVTRYEP